MADQCPLCQDLADIVAQTKIPLYHCRTCDLIYKGRSLHLRPEAERKRYETHNNTLENTGYVQMLNHFLRAAVLPFASKEARILDFGSGPQPVLKVLLEQQGYSVDAYDPFFAPGLPTASYDYITCTEVLEHVFDPLLTLRQLVSLLTPTGTIALMTHFHPGVEAVVDWWYVRDTTHVVFYSSKTLVWIEKEFGLSVLYNDGKKTIVLTY